MKIGIVAFPSKKLQDLANNYRKRYDPHYAQITPHMTLKDAFDIDESHIHEITAAVEKIAKENSPIQIHASRVSSFYPTTNTIFFRVEPTDQLASIHTQLQDTIPYGAPKFVFVPHITIAQKLSDAEHDDIFSQLRMIGVDEEETIDRIHVLYQLEDGSWTTYDTFKLTGAE
jgi:2'-5' RNA ligase